MSQKRAPVELRVNSGLQMLTEVQQLVECIPEESILMIIQRGGGRVGS